MESDPAFRRFGGRKQKGLQLVPDRAQSGVVFEERSVDLSQALQDRRAGHQECATTRSAEIFRGCRGWSRIVRRSMTAVAGPIADLAYRVGSAVIDRRYR